MKVTTLPLLCIGVCLSLGIVSAEPVTSPGKSGKPVIYQVMTRLFGNDNTANKPWGTVEENGVGKFADFTPEALAAIKSYGTTHLWLTGVPHHALVGDYRVIGVSQDDPDVVKGRAGSPYAVKDYYNVNPDLAIDPANRLEEFKALIRRTHDAGMAVMIDIVPNHVARRYEGISRPEGTRDLGQDDDTSLSYHRDNNFYYLPGESFRVPELPEGMKALGGGSHPLADGQFEEIPAKWTGNGSRLAQPKHDDWFETVKVNYGVKPDGSYDFDRLPDGYDMLSTAAHYAYWQHRDVPDSWVKFRDITLYWLNMGVDGFRYDMAEMVPVEFWSYLNSTIKHHYPHATLMAEVYNRSLYRDYLALGRMDLLYDKVDLYDSMKLIMQDKAGASSLIPITESVADIEQHMVHFLENHDEQRIASPEFAGDPMKGKPAMTVSALVGRGATLLYFGQALGEAGDGDAGWGKASRTTIFDYWGLKSIQSWRADGSYSGAELADWQKSLQRFYQKLLQISANELALSGNYREIHSFNLEKNTHYSDQQFSFVRWKDDNWLLIVVNFEQADKAFSLSLPADLMGLLPISENNVWQDLISGKTFEQSADGQWQLAIPANGSLVLKLQ